MSLIKSIVLVEWLMFLFSLMIAADTKTSIWITFIELHFIILFAVALAFIIMAPIMWATS